VHTDVTAVFPWLTHALFSAGAKRTPMRLMDRMSDAIAFLDRDVARRKKKLMATIDWSPDSKAPTKGEHEMVVR
jgi:deoxyhypusine synthase